MSYMWCMWCLCAYRAYRPYSCESHNFLITQEFFQKFWLKATNHWGISCEVGHANSEKKMTSLLDKIPIPREWIPMDSSKQYQLVNLSFYHPTYRRLEEMLGNIHAIKIETIQNPYLWGCYQLKKEEYMGANPLVSVTEWELWHATDENNLESIARYNFNWRLSTRSKFGHGVSFSGDPAYADRYCNNSNGQNRVLILSLVLVRNICNGHSNMVIPPYDADTSSGNDKKVFVKYADNEFYPRFVVYYDSSN